MTTWPLLYQQQNEVDAQLFKTIEEANDLDKIKQLLNENGANPNSVDAHGHTALHKAILVQKNNAVDIARLLLDKNADPNCTSSSDNDNIYRKMMTPPPLAFCAVSNASADVAKLLIERGAEIEGQYSTSGWRALHCYAMVCEPSYNKKHWNDAREMLELLIAKGALINQVDFDLNTPLHYAAKYLSSFAVTTLLKAGANPLLKDKYGKLPVDLVLKGKKFDKLRQILLDAMLVCRKRQDEASTTIEEESGTRREREE